LLLREDRVLLKSNAMRMTAGVPSSAAYAQLNQKIKNSIRHASNINKRDSFERNVFSEKEKTN
jgi:hypothetical protein